MPTIKKIHLGVYGIFAQDGVILMIKKARGPYAGLYDLPGGKIEFGETLEQCLKRELLEETGAQVTRQSFLGVNEYTCRYKKNGQETNFHHVGIYYVVNLVINKLKTSTDEQDSLGAEFVNVEKLSKENTSPIAFEMIKKVRTLN